MVVGQILKSKGGAIFSARPDIKIAEVVQLLRDKNIGAILVSKDDIHIEGIISERDIVRGLAVDGQGLLERTAEELMTKKVVTCTPGDHIDDLMRLMTERRIRHLPVVDENRITGMISIGDVVKARLAELEQEAKALREYIGGQG